MALGGNFRLKGLQHRPHRLPLGPPCQLPQHFLFRPFQKTLHSCHVADMHPMQYHTPVS